MRKALGCYDCGREYGGPGWIEAVIPDAIWAEISPTHNDGGILCISCIAERLEKRGLHHVPVWLCGCEPLHAHSGDSGAEIHLLRHANLADYETERKEET